MSRVGKQPIEVPQGVTVTVSESAVDVQGPKGKLHTALPAGVRVRQQEKLLVVEPLKAGEKDGGESSKDLLARLTKQEKANWGLARSLLANAVSGVSEGFSKKLEIVGVGYKAQSKGKMVVFSLGYSHPVEFTLPDGIEVKVERNKLTVTGIDKQVVGQVAADMRALRPPDPYKQKGVRFVGEYLRKKAGKSAAAVTK